MIRLESPTLSADDASQFACNASTKFGGLPMRSAKDSDRKFKQWEQEFTLAKNIINDFILVCKTCILSPLYNANFCSNNYNKFIKTLRLNKSIFFGRRLIFKAKNVQRPPSPLSPHTLSSSFSGKLRGIVDLLLCWFMEWVLWTGMDAEWRWMLKVDL